MPKFKAFTEIKMSDIDIGKGQVRTHDVNKDIEELAESIRKVGLLEPIIVSKSEKSGKFEIITGQRRFLAHKVLGKTVILAAVLDKRVDETTAKVLSVTENLVRRDLNQRDLIDACTALFKKYGTMTAVAKETGLPPNKVSQYVKYDQLVPELKTMVDKGQVNLQTALRAQRAASVKGSPDRKEAVKLAKGMATFSGPQQKKVMEEREDDPDKAVEQVLEDAKSGSRVTQVVVTLTASVHGDLKKYADEEGTTLDDAARMLIENALSDKGYSR